MSIHVNNLLLSERVLMLQGPMGGFFTKLSIWLKSKGIQCFKVNFNGGDQYDSRYFENTFDYTDSYANFALWIEQLILNQDIDAIVCFGDCRKYHQTAKKIASKQKIKFFAFEEGYIRPNYITFEQDGVNFFSNFLEHLQIQSVKSVREEKEIQETYNQFGNMVVQVIVYYFFMLLYSFKYKNYQHHRQMGIWTELYCWIVAGYRRLKNRLIEPRSFDRFIERHQDCYFVFALQVHNDFQIRTHSEYKCMKKYIEIVIEDFSQNAEKHHHLVLKHHPMDRGYRNYSDLIQKLCKKNGVQGRVHYFCDIHLPTLLKHSIGFITVNSTTGIQALYHQIPIKVLGFALYNLPKLTNQRPLEKFWRNPGKVDAIYFQNFRSKLIEYSQLNGSFYGSSPWMRKYILPKNSLLSVEEKAKQSV